MVASTVLCNNILSRAFEEKIPITPMKLQKLMYFVYGEYLKKTNSPLITENFAVWQYGPVLTSVYDVFKHYHTNPITEYAKDGYHKSYAVDETKNPILKEVIDSIWKKYKDHNGIELSMITHREGSAWSKAFERYDTLLKNEDIKDDNTY